MNRVIVDPVTQAKLLHAGQKLELCDDKGRIIGHFLPLESRSPTTKREPQISEQEIQQRLLQGGGRTLAEIMVDLEKKV